MNWTEERLDQLLTTPSAGMIEDIAKIKGDIMILGAGGKMGPTLATLAKNAVKAAGIEKGSGVPNKDKVATITKAQVKEIAERKMPDLTANTIEAAMSQVAGTCRSMGIVVVD